jgi:hypothetical protein
MRWIVGPWYCCPEWTNYVLPRKLLKKDSRISKHCDNVKGVSVEVQRETMETIYKDSQSPDRERNRSSSKYEEVLIISPASEVIL